MNSFFDEGKKVNQFALDHIEEGYESDHEIQKYLNRHKFNSENVRQEVVQEITERIARAAFGGSPNEDAESPVSFTETLKSLLKKPGVKEGLLIFSVVTLKIAMYYSFKKADKLGVPEIINL